MFRAIIIGNLGSDARVEANNGRPFVSFSVAHNDRFVKEDGTVKETSQWVSCTLNGDGGKLLPFLKKGRQVYVEGRASVRCFSSEKERRFVAGVNLNVDHLELIGSQVDEVPRVLHDADGVMHYIRKAYFINNEEAYDILKGRESALMFTAAGDNYLLTAPCWITPSPQQDTQQQEQVEVFDGGKTDDNTAELQQKMSNVKSKKK